jgi:molecular chaperone GrpE
MVETTSEEKLYLEFVNIGEALATRFPEISEFNDEELEKLRMLIKSFDNLKDKNEFKKNPIVIKAINFVFQNKDKLVNTIDKEAKLAEMKDLLQRTQANFENYRKQVQVQLEDIKKMASRDIILQLLPIIDNFELALRNVSAVQNDNFVAGISLIHSQLMQLLHQNNVLPIETVGRKFDPYHHEALMKVPSELPADTIIEEFQKGFTMHGKVLRHAKVKVSSGAADNSNQHKNNHHKMGGQ